MTGLAGAVRESLLEMPEYLILGMSLEHILKGKALIEKTTKEAEKISGLSWSIWHEVAPIALKKLNAKRIGLITPFDKKAVLARTSRKWHFHAAQGCRSFASRNLSVTENTKLLQSL